MITFRKVVDGPVVIALPERKSHSANRPLNVDAETRVMVIYPPQAIVAEDMVFLGCDCPRMVQRDGCIKVWHSPECPELERIA